MAGQYDVFNYLNEATTGVGQDPYNVRGFAKGPSTTDMAGVTGIAPPTKPMSEKEFAKESVEAYKGAEGQGALQGLKTGAAAGATIGGIAGTVVPGIGNAIGAAAGGLIGGAVGAAAGGLSAKKRSGDALMDARKAWEKQVSDYAAYQDAVKLAQEQQAAASMQQAAGAATPAESDYVYQQFNPQSMQAPGVLTPFEQYRRSLYGY